MRRIRRSLVALVVGTMAALSLAVPTPSFAATVQGTTAQACLAGGPPAASTMPPPFLKHRGMRSAIRAACTFCRNVFISTTEKLALYCRKARST